MAGDARKEPCEAVRLEFSDGSTQTFRAPLLGQTEIVGGALGGPGATMAAVGPICAVFEPDSKRGAWHCGTDLVSEIGRPTPLRCQMGVALGDLRYITLYDGDRARAFLGLLPTAPGLHLLSPKGAKIDVLFDPTWGGGKTPPESCEIRSI